TVPTFQTKAARTYVSDQRRERPGVFQTRQPSRAAAPRPPAGTGTAPRRWPYFRVRPRPWMLRSRDAPTPAGPALLDLRDTPRETLLRPGTLEDLLPQPHERVVLAVDHAFLHRDQRIVG